MGNAYASKSHTHTASQITDFTSQVDSRINSKMPDTSTFIKRRNAFVSVYDNYSSSNPRTITLPSMSVGELMIFRCKVYQTQTLIVRAPSGGTYSIYSNVVGTISGGSTIARYDGNNAALPLESSGFIIRMS